MRLFAGILFLFTLSGCAGGWTAEDKEKFRKDCIEGTYGNLAEDKVKGFCDCYTEQMVKEYPVFNDALERRDSAKNARMRSHCLREIGME